MSHMFLDISSHLPLFGFHHVIKNKQMNQQVLHQNWCSNLKNVFFFFFWGGGGGGFPAEASNRHPIGRMRPVKSRKRDEETSRPVTCCREQPRYTHQNKEAGSEPDCWEHSHPDTAALKRNSTLPDSLHHVPPRGSPARVQPASCYLWKEVYSPMNSQLHPGKWVWRSLNTLL